MSFQAYIDNITAKTGKTPEQIRADAEKAGIITEDMKAKVFCDWLVQQYGIGHGHSMALWNLFIGNKWIVTKHTTLKKKG